MIAPGGALTLLGSTPVGATGGRVSEAATAIVPGVCART
jgi:hypothetical protein